MSSSKTIILSFIIRFSSEQRFWGTGIGLVKNPIKVIGLKFVLDTFRPLCSPSKSQRNTGKNVILLDNKTWLTEQDKVYLIYSSNGMMKSWGLYMI